MKNPVLVRITLSLSGLIAIGVGIGILFLPHAFYASSGILLGDDVNLLNELRASSGPVLVGGLFALAGAVWLRLAVPALAAATLLYFAYGFARLVSVALDGVPNGAMLQITGLELAVGSVCAVVLWNSLRSRSDARMATV